ncbi:MAG: hypothetical protein ACREDC_01015 [Bradyrhizobium sp.]
MRTQEGELFHGLKIGDTVHKHYVLREATTADLIDAEEDAPVSRQIAYQASLVARQTQKLGTFEGPLTMEMVRKLHPDDFNALVEAQQSLGAAGAIAEKK